MPDRLKACKVERVEGGGYVVRQYEMGGPMWPEIIFACSTLAEALRFVAVTVARDGEDMPRVMSAEDFQRSMDERLARGGEPYRSPFMEAVERGDVELGWPGCGGKR